MAPLASDTADRTAVDPSHRTRISRITATAVATAVIGGALALSAPTAGATTTSQVVTAWGGNSSGQTNVPAAAAQSDVMAIAAGGQTAYALTTGGAVIGWGAHASGQTTIPTAAQSGVKAISAEGANVLALKLGSVVGWGLGASPSLPPADLTDAIQVAALSNGGLALRADHTIRAWGTTIVPGNVPATLQGHTASIDAGDTFGVAMTDNNSVVAWGSGAGATVPDVDKSGVLAVVAAGGMAAEIRIDHSVATWGRTDLGPTPAAAMSGVLDVVLGSDFAVALKSDGTLVSWGPGNASGQQNIPATAGYQVSGLAAGSNFAMTLHGQLAMVPPVINGTPPPAVQGQPYDFTVTAAGTGGIAHVTAGTLPAGLSMNSSGRITGTPTTAGQTTVTVTVTTGLGSASWPMTVTVRPAP